jgi:preprotein translocase subunit SecG
MLQVLLAIEIVLALALVGVILLQRSEGGALGMGGGAGVGGLLSARGASNLLTRATAVIAFAFIAVALLLANLEGKRGESTSVFDQPAATGATPAPATTGEDGLPPVEAPTNEDEGAAGGDDQESGGS